MRIACLIRANSQGARNEAVVVALLALLVCVIPIDPRPVIAQDLLGDTIGFSGASLNLKSYVDIDALGGGSEIISMTHQPLSSGTSPLFTTVQTGVVYATQTVGDITTTNEWFNYNDAVSVSVSNASNGFTLDSPTGAHGGLRSIAFHPEFETNGKFYTSAMIDRPSGVSGINYLGNSASGFDSESAVAEWTYDHGSQSVDQTSYRELFRVQMPVFDHPIKQIAFNNLAQPGDEDYGLLYITHGDGSVQSAISGGGQNRDDALGKVLRIDPLQSGGSPYTTPNSPFASDPTTLDEIYTLGHRNPHHISFAETNTGGTVPIVAEVGRDNIEEINLLQSGGDYGWSDREGTFVHHPDGGVSGDGYGLGYGVSNLTANEWQLNDYVYPAAQYDHDANPGNGFVGSAVAGGFTIQNGSDPALQGQYLFADFAFKSGHVYQAALDDLTGAHTQLADGELPNTLSQAAISRLMLTLDDDADGTIDNTANDINSLLGVSRSDLRFGQGPSGEMYISSKSTGKVYLVENTLPGLAFGSLTLQVSADDGTVQFVNQDGTPTSIRGYSILSASGALDAASWISLQDNANYNNWQEANPTAEALSELNSVSDLEIAAIGPSIGSPIVLNGGESFGSPVTMPTVTLEYTTTEGEVLQGVVELSGLNTINNLLLTVDPATGEAVLSNSSTTTVRLRGYSILSESGSLKPGNGDWESLADQGVTGIAEANPKATDLSELISEGAESLVLTPGESFLLGDLFDITGTQDLELEFVLSLGSEGDFDGDGDVDGTDFLVWQRTDGSSAGLADWSTNYGEAPGGANLQVFTGVVVDGSVALSAATSSVSVPEPSTATAAIVALVLWCKPSRTGRRAH